MAHSNGVITAPVGIDADIAPVLGVGSYDLGYLCSNAHGKINKWSYIKPKEANTPDFNNANLPGLIYDSVNKTIVYDAPKTWYRALDFDGYDHNAKPPTIDNELLLNPVSSTSVRWTLTITPYWADPRYNWGSILGGFTWANMKIKVEVYNKNNVLVDSGTFTVSDIADTGRVSLELLRNGLIVFGDTFIYLKGYFCDYNGNVLCMIPSSSDGLVKKPIVVTQSLYIYIGETTANASGFAVTGSLVGGDGGTSAQCRLSVTNNTSSNYVASAGRPYARYRWRAKDGSYTGSWSGNISMPSCANIPKSFTRMDTVDAGSPPSYGNVTQWYIDYQVVMY